MTTILTAAAVTFGATLVVFGVLLVKMGRQKRADDQHIADQNERIDGKSDALRQAHRQLDEHAEEICDLREQTRRLTSERDKAIRDGQLAAKAGMGALAKERSEFLESLQAWMLIANAALLSRAPLALPAAQREPTPPQPLPSGDFLTADEDGPLILQVDDLEVPVGARGTGAS